MRAEVYEKMEAIRKKQRRDRSNYIELAVEQFNKKGGRVE